MRTLVIGDIHGGLKALIQVMDRASVTTEDALIFLGDYVDGWSESAQVVEHVINLCQTQQCICIKGNHDDWCEDWLRTGNADKTWLYHGGLATVKSYASIDIAMKKKHLSFFKKMSRIFKSN